MQSTQTLPDGYRNIGTLDVSKDQRLLVILNLFGLLLMGVFGGLFFLAIFWLRGHDRASVISQMQFSSPTSWMILIVAILGLTVLHIILHEAIHGIFFWLFTHSRPRFAFRWSYAYAAAPDWFIPRNLFFITTLAPFALMSLIGLLIFSVGPIGLIMPTWFVISMNAGGAVGDMIVAIWLLRQPATCLAQDKGDAVTLYVPGAN